MKKIIDLYWQENKVKRKGLIMKINRIDVLIKRAENKHKQFLDIDIMKVMLFKQNKLCNNNLICAK